MQSPQPRNQFVAESLNEQDLRTLLLDLLTVSEEQHELVTAEHRFDIGLLGERVGRALDWAADELGSPALGVFGASTGAAAALVAAATRPAIVGAWYLEAADPISPPTRSQRCRHPLCSSSEDATPLSLD